MEEKGDCMCKCNCVSKVIVYGSIKLYSSERRLRRVVLGGGYSGETAECGAKRHTESVESIKS